MTTTANFKTRNLRGQALHITLEPQKTITTTPVLNRCQKARGINPKRQEQADPSQGGWIKGVPTTTCEHWGKVPRSNQWALGQRQTSRWCQRLQVRDAQVFLAAVDLGQGGIQQFATNAQRG